MPQVSITTTSISFHVLCITEAQVEETAYSFPRPPVYESVIGKMAEPRAMKEVKHTVAPNFTGMLRDKAVPVGAHVKLLCSVTGIPEPRIVWYKDGNEITDDHYVVTVSRFNGNHYKLQTYLLLAILTRLYKVWKRLCHLLCTTELCWCSFSSL